MNDTIDIPDNDIELQVARLGIEAVAFKSSTFGRLLLARVNQEIEGLRDELEDFNDDDNRIRLDIRARRLLLTYIEDAIQDGRTAEMVIEQEESEIPNE